MDRDQGNIAPDLLARLVPLPDLPPVHYPDLPAPSTVDEGKAEPIFLTAPQSPMEEGKEPNFFANENNYIVKASLIKHLTYAYTNGQLRWPKSFSEYQKKVMPLIQNLVTRTEAILRARLLIRPSIGATSIQSKDWTV